MTRVTGSIPALPTPIGSAVKTPLQPTRVSAGGIPCQQMRRIRWSGHRMIVLSTPLLQVQHEVTAFPNRGIGCPGLRGDYPALHPITGRCRRSTPTASAWRRRLTLGCIPRPSTTYNSNQKPPSHSMHQPVASLPAEPTKRSLPPSRFPISECSIAPDHHSSRVPPLQDPP